MFSKRFVNRFSIISAVAGITGSVAHADATPAPTPTATPSMEDRVSSLENANAMNIFSFGATFITRYDHINSDLLGDTDPLRLYVALDANAKVNDRLSFYTRFAASKYWNAVTSQGLSTSADLNASRDTLGSAIYLERAFMNYRLTSSLTLTLGRLPTADGPPYNLYDDVSRQGTYPMLAYGSELDGMALTYNLSSLLPAGHKLSFRLIYTPLTNDAQNSLGESVPAGVNGSASGSPSFLPISPITSLMLDYSTTQLGFADQFTSIVQFVDLANLQFGDLAARGTTFGSYQFGSMSDCLAAGLPSSVCGLQFQGSNVVASYDALTFYEEAQNIAHTGLTIGATVLGTWTSSSGLLENNPALLSAGVPSIGFMTDQASASHFGSAVMLTATYHLPIPALNNPLIGVEYLKSDQYYQYFQLDDWDMTNFYATRGQAAHIWYTQPLGSGVKWRTGFMYQDNQYSQGYVGAINSIGDASQRTVYTQIRLDI